MRAEMTFGGRPLIRIHVNRVVRARLHASLAADTSFRAEIDDAIFSLVHRRDWADCHAGRVLAVIATGNLENPSRVWENALFYVLHPGTVHTQRNKVFSFACHRTSVTPNAFAIVDDESVSHAFPWPNKNTIILV
jgi:hypothetical protein